LPVNCAGRGSGGFLAHGRLPALPLYTVLAMNTGLKNFLTDERGQDVVEYSLLLVLIGAVVLIYLTGMGLNLASLLQQIGAKLELFANTTS